MTSQRNDPYKLQQIFKKLGHGLEEIRVRAVQSLTSKLQHGLLADADLVQEKQLHIRLLEWFNFPSVPCQQEVLELICNFSKHPSAAAIYLDIGAVDFLTQLRQNTSPSLHPIIDTILDHLFHLSSAPAPTQTQGEGVRGGGQGVGECAYRQRTQGQQHSMRQQQLQGQSQLQTGDGAMMPGGVSFEGGVLGGTMDDSVPASQHMPSPADTAQGYFTARTHDSNGPLGGSGGGGIVFSMFPWLPLTATDKHVLASTDTSLRGGQADVVVSACHFLSDVVFQDFPAEVFLQRPSIVKSLLSLVSVSVAREVCGCAMLTLTDLTRDLHARIHYAHDPAFYTPKQEFSLMNSVLSASSASDGSTLTSESPASVSAMASASASALSDSRPSVIGGRCVRQRGDGQDGGDDRLEAESKRQAKKLRLKCPAPATIPCPKCPRKFCAKIGLTSHLRTHKDE